MGFLVDSSVLSLLRPQCTQCPSHDSTLSGPFSENLKHGIELRRLETQVLSKLDIRNLVEVFVDPGSRDLEPFRDLSRGQKFFTHERHSCTVHGFVRLAAHPPGRDCPGKKTSSRHNAGDVAVAALFAVLSGKALHHNPP